MPLPGKGFRTGHAKGFDSMFCYRILGTVHSHVCRRFLFSCAGNIIRQDFSMVMSRDLIQLYRLKFPVDFVLSNAQQFIWF